MSENLSRMVSDYLAKNGFTESVGPPVGYFYAPSGIQHTYVTVAKCGYSTECHAERSFVAMLAETIPRACPKEANVRRCVHLFWRAAPLVEIDEFGLWGFHARFVMADPFFFTCTVPALPAATPPQAVGAPQ